MQTPKFTKVFIKVLATLLGAALVTTLIGSPASAGPSSPASQLRSIVGQARRDAGVKAISGHSALSTLAKRQAQRMAAAGAIFHNRRIKDELNAITTDWTVVGENVGRGYSVESIHDAMMRSTSHRNNVLSTKWNKMSIAVAIGSDGRYYVAEIFAFLT